MSLAALFCSARCQPQSLLIGTKAVSSQAGYLEGLFGEYSLFARRYSFCSGSFENVLPGRGAYVGEGSILW